ncbi:MAG: radical SAM protein [bacterium]
MQRVDIKITQQEQILRDLHHQIVKKNHQSPKIKNYLILLKEYFTDSLFLLKKFGFKKFFNFWYTKFFIVDEGGEFDLNRRRIRKNPHIVKKTTKIELEITTVCNKKCVLCSHTYWNYKQEHMSFEKFKKILDDIPSLRWINLAGIGSNMLNKDYIKMLEYASAKNLNVNIVDEFEFLDEAKARKIIELGINSIYVSFDAAKKETYEKMKKGCDYDQFMTNLKTLIALKEEMKSPFPVLHFRFIIHKENYDQISEYIDLVSSLRPRGIRARVEFIGVIVFENNKKYAMPIEEVPFEIKKDVYEKALNYGINLNFSHASVSKPSINSCIRWAEPFILVSGEVIPCCSILLQSKRDFLKKYSLGNVFKRTFYDIWNDKKYKEFRVQVLDSKAKVPTICKYCCSHDHQERAAKYGYSE